MSIVLFFSLFSACLCLCTLGYTFTGTPLRNLPPFFALPIWVASWTFFLPPWLQGSRGHLARGRQCTHGKVFSAFSIPGSLIFIGMLLRLPTTRIHCVNSCPALSQTQASALSGETLAVLTAGISKRWPRCRLGNFSTIVRN